MKTPYADAYAALKKAVEEERDRLKTMVDDPDSMCAARSLRRERMNAMQHVLDIADELEHWDW